MKLWRGLTRNIKQPICTCFISNVLDTVRNGARAVQAIVVLSSRELTEQRKEILQRLLTTVDVHLVDNQTH